jgi:hypothetical protein
MDPSAFLDTAMKINTLTQRSYHNFNPGCILINTSYDTPFNLIGLHAFCKFRKIGKLNWELDITALKLFTHLFIYLWYNQLCRQ